MRKNKAITLISLIITIVVLIILAGVTINLTLGENGILKRAQNAKERNKESSAREKVELVLLNANIEKEENVDYNSEDFLTQMLEDNDIAVEGDYVTVDGYNYLIDRQKLRILDELGETQITITYEVKEYLGKNENDKYEITLLVTVQSNTPMDQSSFREPNGSEIIISTEKFTFAEDVTMELDEEYVIEVKTKDGQIRTKAIIEESEEQITTVEKLVGLREAVNSGLTYAGKTITLESDLDLSSVCGESIGTWIPIGTEEKTFKGIFNGNNKTISNMYIHTSNINQGLFGFVSEGEIKNIILQGEIKNAGQNTGGIIGYSTNTKIENCINYANISANGTGGVGFLGGIVGANLESQMLKCINYGNITSGTTYIGGISGNLSGNIEKCINYGTIRSRAATGGIAGHFSGNMQKCANYGEVYATDTADSYIGGIVGCIWIGTTVTITDTYNANLTRGYGSYVAGIVGYLGGQVTTTNCYNSGTIYGSRRSSIVYRVTGTAKVNNSYYLNTCNASGTGTSKTAEQLKQLATTLGENYQGDIQNDDGTWKYNNGYPILKWQVEDNI